MSTIAEWWRWVIRFEWELVGLELTDETSMHPPIWSPLAIETWRCQRTGAVREVWIY